ncbi:hypothetical protein FisN_25Hu065 [Fistulifera solaris]|uniref:Uncharacterized protein n=1 Tax=Fistulifera solaris TaxID=1519565 RepID=A0A1Z5JVY2_FISSO|nr:hypothetical protein FisN_25Hu065 [Fistulifera solaris]|eukprot:GAX18089.1 hypothetical protein FisN_25Hu065 [Fistulifera solaris]
MEETLDHLSKRVVVAGSVGSIVGVLQALYKGHARLPRTAALTMLSCALTATACFGSERFLYTTITEPLMGSTRNALLASHAAGGVVAGAWLGGLYLRRPLRGVVFFTPAMILLGYGEWQLRAVRKHVEKEMREKEKREAAQ